MLLQNMRRYTRRVCARTGLAPRERVHEGGLARAGRAHERGQRPLNPINPTQEGTLCTLVLRPASTSMKVVLPAPDAPMSAISTP